MLASDCGITLSRDFARALDPVLLAQDCGITPDPWQAELLRSTAARALLLCSRQSGKTTVTALIALHTALYTEKALVVVVSPSQRQSAEMLRVIRLLHEKLQGSPAIATESVLKVEFANGSRILAYPGTERTIRGLAGVTLAVVDEASRVEDALLVAERPMLATSKGRLIALSTPAGKRGWFFEAWHGDPDRWKRVRVSAEDCPRISKEFLDEELRELGPTRFSEEYMLTFSDAQEAMFPVAVIAAAFTAEVAPLWN